MNMASTTAMVRPPAGRPPPPPPSGSRPKPPPPPKKAPPPPPPKRVPPPPPPPKSAPKAPPSANGSANKTAKRALDTDGNSEKRARNNAGNSVSIRAPVATGSGSALSIRAPVVLRDVNVFTKEHQVGQGTYGSVFVGTDKITKEVVALKRINTEQEENGFPITAIREVKILKALKHENIVELKEIVTSKEQGGAIPKNVFMVFEYMEYDLTGILDTPEIRFTQDHIKSWSKQLLSGAHFMHRNKVIHRDLKASNLLINAKGQMKIADWGLARSWNSEMKRLTNKVITLWYRPPELLLGCIDYSPKIDMWSIGCIIAEMFRRSGFLKGANEATQLDLIFRTCGHPTKEHWPDIEQKCRLWKQFAPTPDKVLPDRLETALKTNLPNPQWMTKNAIELISKLLSMNPDKRWSAQEALLADYFFEVPPVKDAENLSMNFGVKSIHEWECKKKYEKKMASKNSATRV